MLLFLILHFRNFRNFEMKLIGGLRSCRFFTALSFPRSCSEKQRPYVGSVVCRKFEVLPINFQWCKSKRWFSNNAINRTENASALNWKAKPNCGGSRNLASPPVISTVRKQIENHERTVCLLQLKALLDLFRNICEIETSVRKRNLKGFFGTVPWNWIFGISKNNEMKFIGGLRSYRFFYRPFIPPKLQWKAKSVFRFCCLS